MSKESIEKGNPEQGDFLLVLLAGQSNMAGRGFAESEDLTAIENLLMIRPDGQWQAAVEPVTRDRDYVGTFDASGNRIEGVDPFETVMPQEGQKVCGVGPGRTFGRLLAEANPGKTVGLIPTAVGGTAIRAWLPGGKDQWSENLYPYDDAVKKAQLAQKYGKIVAVLWHQGESDALNQTEDYKEKLRTVIANFRKDLSLGPEVPFIAGDMGSFYPENIRDHIDIVDQALAVLETEDTSFSCVRTKDLTHRGDHLHFDTPSQHLLGKRYFEAYTRFCEKNKSAGI